MVEKPEFGVDNCPHCGIPLFTQRLSPEVIKSLNDAFLMTQEAMLENYLAMIYKLLEWKGKEDNIKVRVRCD